MTTEHIGKAQHIIDRFVRTLHPAWPEARPIAAGDRWVVAPDVMIELVAHRAEFPDVGLIDEQLLGKPVQMDLFLRPGTIELR